jgi:hypothetical protein
MLGSGQLDALDAQGKVLLSTHIKMPLAQSIAAIRRAALMDEKSWKRVCEITTILCAQKSLPLNFASQMRLAQTLRGWRDTTLAEMELTSVRLHQLQKQLDDAPALWQNTSQTIAGIKVLLQELSAKESAALLESTAALDAESTTAILQSWQKLQHALDENQTRILQLWGRLSNPQMTPSKNLIEKREALLKQFLEGEKVLFNTQLLQDAKTWDDEFCRQYRDWHQQQFTDKRWQQLRHFAYQPALQALKKLENVKRYPFPNHFKLNADLQTALRRQCPRDGSLLITEVACNQCQLKMGQVAELPDLEEFSTQIENSAQQFFELLQSEDIKRHLQRNDAGRALLNWNGEAESVLALLDASVLMALENALLPRRRFQRSVKSLRHKIGKGGTRVEMESTFKDWLEAGDAVGAEDEITIDDEP